MNKNEVLINQWVYVLALKKENSIVEWGIDQATVLKRDGDYLKIRYEKPSYNVVDVTLTKDILDQSINSINRMVRYMKDGSYLTYCSYSEKQLLDFVKLLKSVSGFKLINVHTRVVEEEYLPVNEKNGGCVKETKTTVDDVFLTQQQEESVTESWEREEILKIVKAEIDNGLKYVYSNNRLSVSNDIMTIFLTDENGVLDMSKVEYAKKCFGVCNNEVGEFTTTKTYETTTLPKYETTTLPKYETTSSNSQFNNGGDNLRKLMDDFLMVESLINDRVFDNSIWVKYRNGSILITNGKEYIKYNQPEDVEIALNQLIYS